MKILLYGLNYSPELTGIGKYSGEMCSWLASHGHEVCAITAPPYYPAWRIWEGYRGLSYRSEVIDGVKVLRCPLWVPKNPSGAKRIIHLFSYAASSLPAAVLKALSWRPDIIISIEPAVFSAPGAWASARLCGAKAWLHIQDFELDAAFDLGMVRSPFVKKAVMGFERWLMGRFDVVSTISARMFERLGAKGVKEKDRFLFPNWVDTNEIFQLDSQSPMRKGLALGDDVLVLLYSGNMGEKQGLEIIIEAAKRTSDRDDLVYILCGDGAVRKRLVEGAKGLSNVRFMELQPLEKLNELLNMADVHLLPQRADVEDLVMPSKLLGIFASGRPVVATARPGTQIERAVRGRGLVVEPGDVDAFTGAILRLAGDAELRRAYGASARVFCVENWGKEEVLARFEEALKQTVAASRPSSG